MDLPLVGGDPIFIIFQLVFTTSGAQVVDFTIREKTNLARLVKFDNALTVVTSEYLPERSSFGY